LNLIRSFGLWAYCRIIGCCDYGNTERKLGDYNRRVLRRPLRLYVAVWEVLIYKFRLGHWLPWLSVHGFSQYFQEDAEVVPS